MNKLYPSNTFTQKYYYVPRILLLVHNHAPSKVFFVEEYVNNAVVYVPGSLQPLGSRKAFADGAKAPIYAVRRKQNIGRNVFLGTP